MTSPAKKEYVIIRYFKGLLIKNKAFLLGQVLAVQGLMQLLMKNRNTGEKGPGRK